MCFLPDTFSYKTYKSNLKEEGMKRQKDNLY
jgi:hypothetical protein